MSLPPLGTSVEAQSFNAHVLQSLAGSSGTEERRLDKRALHAPRRRKTVATLSSSSSSGGEPQSATAGLLSSATVTSGDSHVVCAVKGGFGPPDIATPQLGRLRVNVALPLCEQALGGGGPGGSQEVKKQLALFVADTVEAVVDREELCIAAGEACWVLTLSIVVISPDGALRDQCVHAAMAALHQLRLPRARLPNGDSTEPRSLSLHRSTVTCLTVAVALGAGKKCLLVDTTAAEEAVADAVMTIVVSPSKPHDRNIDGEWGVLSCAHHGGWPCPADVMEAAVEAAFRAARQIASDDE